MSPRSSRTTSATERLARRAAPSIRAEDRTTFVLARALTYSVLFIGFLLVFLPARLLERTGVTRPPDIGALQIAGMIIGVIGGVIALWCIGTFALIGHGTPAPFDPPRRLVIAGPYRWVRNPMYIGAGLALAGAALFYESWAMFGYCAAFLVAMHLFVVIYEEPTLSSTFGSDYGDYTGRVRRWLPGKPSPRA